jgi:hypothetical protein
LSLINDILKQLEASRSVKKPDNSDQLCGNKLYVETNSPTVNTSYRKYLVVPILLLIFSVSVIIIKKSHSGNVYSINQSKNHASVKASQKHLINSSAAPFKSRSISSNSAQHVSVASGPRVSAALPQKLKVNKLKHTSLPVPAITSVDVNPKHNLSSHSLSTARVKNDKKHRVTKPLSVITKQVIKLKHENKSVAKTESPAKLPHKPSHGIIKSAPTASNNQLSSTKSGFSIKEVKPVKHSGGTLRDVIELSASCPGCAISQLKLMHRTDLDAVHLLAELYLKNRQLVDAQQYISQAMLQYNNDIHLSQLLARVYLLENKAHESITILLKHNPMIKDHPDYYNLLGAAYYQDHYYDIAAKYFRELTEAFPNNGRYWATYGFALSELKQYANARAALTKAVSLGDLGATLENNVEHTLGILSRSRQI